MDISYNLGSETCDGVETVVLFDSTINFQSMQILDANLWPFLCTAESFPNTTLSRPPTFYLRKMHLLTGGASLLTDYWAYSSKLRLWM